MTLSRSLLVLVCGSIALALALGIRQSFGLFLVPVSHDAGWTVPALTVGFAVQQLVWGAVQPVIGAVADTRGPRAVVAGGGLAYAAGLLLMAYGGSVAAFQIGAGLLVGIALGAVGFSVVLGAVARATPEDRRSARLGIASAGGSFGMFAMVPIGQILIDTVGWQEALTVLALFALAIAVLAMPLGGASRTASAAGPTGPGLKDALGAAMRHEGFWLLTAGFFVCGFHLAFISVHLPGYVASCGLPPEVGTWALALVGLSNVVGSLVAGQLGGKHRPKYLLAGIYGLRGVVILGFMLLPKTPAVVVGFAFLMGFLWLSTVPLTTGIVAGIFGPRFVSTLFGLVFFGHQVGAFLGALSGGLSLAWFGDYDAVWWVSLGLAVASALLHLPIRDARLPRFAPA
ncbi:MFS transporter [Indioceanicola profundi]|uniref:MFS transporter n=1 Tax=Indioceanicola profundi TaxID=2220096 RepID=UPI000E6ABFF2|nr:MFS transporter [Indioceanicola profundi]